MSCRLQEWCRILISVIASVSGQRNTALGTHNHSSELELTPAFFTHKKSWWLSSQADSQSLEFYKQNVEITMKETVLGISLSQLEQRMTMQVFKRCPVWFLDKGSLHNHNNYHRTNCFLQIPQLFPNLPELF